MKKNKIRRNIFIISVFIFLYLPIFILVIYSFNASKMNIVFTHFTLKWYKELLSNTTLIEAFRNTIIIAVTSTVISTILGTISAVGLNKYDFKGKGFINSLIYIPIVIPEIVLGISLLSVYTLFHLELGITSIIIAHITFSIPYVITSVRSTLNALSKEIEEASYDLGASKLKTFTKVYLPLTISGAFNGSLMVFIPAIGYFFITDILGGGKIMIIGNLIKNQFLTARNWPFGAAISIFLIIISLLLVRLYRKIGGDMDELGGGI